MEQNTLGQKMILPDFILPARANQIWQYSGIDDPGRCLDDQHFREYPYPVKYVYNSRGFRDLEWPDSIDELKKSIWCVGDSFTVGIGSPIEHTWPYLLSKATGLRVINVSLDGASNDWMSRKIINIQEEISPKYIIVSWTYLHREESPDARLDDEQRRIYYQDLDLDKNIKNFEENIRKITSARDPFMQFLIPNAYLNHRPDIKQTWDNLKGSDWPEHMPCDIGTLSPDIVDELKNLHGAWDTIKIKNILHKQMCTIDRIMLDNQIVQVQQKDLARDGHHFDIKTSEWMIDQLLPKLDR